jgi:hypothetical protein
MSEVGLPFVGALHCLCGLGSPPKFGLGGGFGLPNLSGGGDFLLLLRARSLPSVSLRDWGTVAAVPLVIDGPACVPTVNPNGQPCSMPFDGTPTCFSNGCPTGQPQAVPIMLIVACPPCAPAWDPTGTPTVRPPANAWGLAHVGSGRRLVCGGEVKINNRDLLCLRRSLCLWSWWGVSFFCPLGHLCRVGPHPHLTNSWDLGLLLPWEIPTLCVCHTLVPYVCADQPPTLVQKDECWDRCDAILGHQGQRV